MSSPANRQLCPISVQAARISGASSLSSVYVCEAPSAMPPWYFAAGTPSWVGGVISCTSRRTTSCQPRSPAGRGRTGGSARVQQHRHELRHEPGRDPDVPIVERPEDRLGEADGMRAARSERREGVGDKRLPDARRNEPDVQLRCGAGGGGGHRPAPLPDQRSVQLPHDLFVAPVQEEPPDQPQPSSPRFRSVSAPGPSWPRRDA